MYKTYGKEPTYYPVYDDEHNCEYCNTRIYIYLRKRVIERIWDYIDEQEVQIAITLKRSLSKQRNDLIFKLEHEIVISNDKIDEFKYKIKECEKRMKAITCIGQGDIWNHIILKDC
jgi:Zn-finger protein